MSSRIPGHRKAMRLASLALLAFSLVCTAQTGDSASLRGTIRDSQGHAVADATIELRSDASIPPLTTHTDANGNYSLTALREGLYHLHASNKDGTAEANSVFLPRSETKTLDLTLISPGSSTTKPQFFDQPQFTVSGVTDTTALGGHGSDTVVRSRDSLAKDAASLSSSPSEASSDRLRATEKLLRESLDREPDKADLHHRLASVEEALGDPLEAVRQYQRAAELDPSEPYLFDWGSELLLHHAPDPAIEVFAKGNRLFPRSARMLVGVGASWYARGSYDQAVNRIYAAADINPSDPMPYLFLGKLQSAESSISTEAAEKLHRFVELHPESAEANYYYAVALWKQRKHPLDKAAASTIEHFLDKAIHLDPKFSAASLQLGILRSEQGNTQGAISSFQQAIKADSQMEQAHYRLAQAYRQAGDAERSKEELRLYQQLSQQSAERAERERHEIRQFVYELRDPASSAH